MSVKNQRRTAWLLLIAFWFQTGVALGAALVGDAAGLVLCRNGVLVTTAPATEEAETLVYAPCLMCRSTALDDEPDAVDAINSLSQLRPAHHTRKLDHADTPSVPASYPPQARAPPCVLQVPITR